MIFFNTLRAIRDSLNIWAFTDCHVPTNTGKLAAACIDMDGTFDVALNLGDTFSEENKGDTQGGNIVTELSNLSENSISDIYPILGNHDDNGISDAIGANGYFQKWIDPAGANPSFSQVINASRPYAITAIGDTSYASYYIEIGNLLIIMLGDRNEGDPPMGEDGLSGDVFTRRRVAGGLSAQDWADFKDLIESNTNKIIIVCSHHAIFETTIGSGRYEFWDALNQTDYNHNLYDDPVEASYGGCLAYIGNSLAVDDIDTWLTANGQYISLWISGHYHRKVGETWNGRERKAEKYGITFLNVAPINTAHHPVYANLLESKSNFLTITGNNVKIKTYIHEDPNGVLPEGFYSAEEINVKLTQWYREYSMV